MRSLVVVLAALALTGCGEDVTYTPEGVADSICAAAHYGADALEQGKLHEDVPEDVWKDALALAVKQCPDDLTR